MTATVVAAVEVMAGMVAAVEGVAAVAEAAVAEAAVAAEEVAEAEDVAEAVVEAVAVEVASAAAALLVELRPSLGGHAALTIRRATPSGNVADEVMELALCRVSTCSGR